MKLQKIHRQRWMEAHPRMQSIDTDQRCVDFASGLSPIFKKLELTGQMIHKNRAVSYFIWYLKNYVNNSGSWNTFIRLHKQLYGCLLSFYALTEPYANDEMNPEDVSFPLWTLLSPITDSSPSPWNPSGSSLFQLASNVYAALDAHFEQASLTGDESTEWLPDVRVLLPPPGPALDVLSEMNLPRDIANLPSASGGKQVVYLKDYVDLRRFCVDALKWAGGEDSLMPELANRGDFVFFANPKGISLIPNITACSRDERSSGCNPGIAEQEGAESFYILELCPIDLLHYVMQHGSLPEIVFPFGDGRRLLHGNWDLIARRYLGKYYSEDFYEEERKQQ